MSATESEIVSIVNELRLKRSTDNISLNIEIIKHVIPNIAKPISYISNKSFFDGTFPYKMKIAKIMSICLSSDLYVR